MGAKILLVEHNSNNTKLLKEVLLNEGYTVHTTDNGLEVLDLAIKIRPDIILLDIKMPGLDGFEVCKLLKKSYEIKDIPVIMVTAKYTSSYVKKALELGAFDYIKKPFDEEEIIARTKSALRFKFQQDKLKEMAMKDSLTGLYNHGLLIELFEKEFSRHNRMKKNISFVMIDIDNFKGVNDNFGHLTGDMVLREVSNIIINSIRKGDIAGRYGGEEFSIVLCDIDKEISFSICERIRENIENFNFSTDDKSIDVTVSIGICFKNIEDNISSTEMIKRADFALYKAKKNGRNKLVSFNE